MKKTLLSIALLLSSGSIFGASGRPEYELSIIDEEKARVKAFLENRYNLVSSDIDKAITANRFTKRNPDSPITAGVPPLVRASNAILQTQLANAQTLEQVLLVEDKGVALNRLMQKFMAQTVKIGEQLDSILNAKTEDELQDAEETP